MSESIIGLSITLRLVEPVLATGIEGDPNSSVSLPFIPGSMLRGVLAERYRATKTSRQMDAAAEAERRLFFDGRTRYLNAYPFFETRAPLTSRGLPAPLSWRTKKKTTPPTDAYDFSIALPEVEQTSPVTGFVAIEGSGAYPAERIVQINVHTQRDANFGRPVEGSGAVFRFEAQAAGTCFQSFILFEREEDLIKIQELLADRNMLLGGARTAGYGRVCVEAIERLPEDWREAGSELLTELLPDETYPGFAVHCLSDILLRDENGQYTLDLIPALSARLGVTLSAATRGTDEEGESAGAPLVFRKSRLVGGFNRKTGLPLMQTRALMAGSLFILQADQPVTGQDLLELEQQGLGERRAEGFGRIAFYPLVPPETEDQEDLPGLRPVVSLYSGDNAALSGRVSNEAAQLAVRQMDEATRALTTLVLRRLLEQQMEKRLQKAINTFRLTTPTKPSNHAISRWRVLIRSCLTAGQIERLNKHLIEEQEKASSAWRAFERTRIEFNGKAWRLSEWIAEMLNHSGDPWAQMEGMPVSDLGFEDDQIVVSPDAKDALHYCLRLLDGVLSKIAHQTGGNE